MTHSAYIYAECVNLVDFLGICYAERCHAECNCQSGRFFYSVVMLSVIMLNVLMVNVITLSVIMFSVVASPMSCVCWPTFLKLERKNNENKIACLK